MNEAGPLNQASSEGYTKGEGRHHFAIVSGGAFSLPIPQVSQERQGATGATDPAVAAALVGMSARTDGRGCMISMIDDA